MCSLSVIKIKIERVSKQYPYSEKSEHTATMTEAMEAQMNKFNDSIPGMQYFKGSKTL